MFSSHALHNDLNLPFPSSSFKEETDLLHLNHHPIGSGLLGYRSAPSSLLMNLNEAETMYTNPDISLFQIQRLDHHQQQVTDFGPGLVRQRTSPAGLFDHRNVDSGFGGVKQGAKGPLGFSSRQNSLLSQISEVGEEAMDASGEEEGDRVGGSQCYIPGFAVSGGRVLPESFSGGMRFREAMEAQNLDARKEVFDLACHFTSPKRVTDATTMEKFLQIQEAVPCKVRAKRGCATHPRSIAERVRRTKISERMRKLQELVPNMDKQMSTSDMLDLAVQYIKELQKQAKVLSENRTNCTCSSNQRTCS